MTDDLRTLLEEREDRAKERIVGVLDAIEALRVDVRSGATGIHTRLDTLNGKVAKHDERLGKLEQRTAYQDGIHSMEGRLQPGREPRREGDEEMSIRVTPKMWAALVAVASVLYTVLHYVFRVWTGS